MKRKDIIYIAIIIILGWWASSKAEPQKVFVDVPVPGPVRYMERDTLECKPVVIIKKEQVVKEYKLPEAITTDKAIHVTAMGEIAPYAGTTLVTAIYNSTSGGTRLLSRQEPLPWFDFINDKALGMRYGLSSFGTEFDIYGRWSLIRIKSIVGSFYAEATSNADFKAMIQAEVRW
jgi:hypothetical protein